MRLEKVLIIFFKELHEVTRTKYVLFSIIGIPILMGVVLPLSYLAPIAADPQGMADSENLGIPGLKLTDNWDSLDPVAQFVIVMIEFSNLMFLLLPMILPSVIAADTFSGERERGTAEALVAAPVTDGEIYLGKVGSSFIPTIVSLWGVGIIYIFIVNYFTADILGYNYLPNLTFIGMIVFLGPLLGLATINIMIWVSTKTTSTRDAQQLGSLISFPLMGIIVGTIGLSAIYSSVFLWISVVLSIILNIFLTKLGISILDRERWVR